MTSAHPPVLIVDDNPFNLEVLRSFLEVEGVASHTVADGRAAVAAATLHVYRLILMDLAMPQIDGFAAARAIRELGPPHGAATILAITATSLGDVEARSRAAGIDGVLRKPVSLKMVRAILESHLGDVSATALPLTDACQLGAMRDDLGPENLDRLLGLFVDDTQTRARWLEAAVAAGDVGRVGEVAHALAGSASTFHAPALAALAQETEGHARAGRDRAASALGLKLAAVALDTVRAFGHVRS